MWSAFCGTDLFDITEANKDLENNLHTNKVEMEFMSEKEFYKDLLMEQQEQM